MATGQDRKPPKSKAAAEIAALQAFLLWARDHGFGFDTATVGSVQITGARDLTPTVATQTSAIAARQREADIVEHDSIYDVVGSDLPGYEQMRGARPA